MTLPPRANLDALVRRERRRLGRRELGLRGLQSERLASALQLRGVPGQQPG